MNWEQLKRDVYFHDGSLRDMYVLNTDRSDWETWIEYVNENFETRFHISETEETFNGINIDAVFDYWNGNKDFTISSTIYLNEVLVKCYFFSEDQIENDITPKEIISIEDHNNLVDYMISISKALNKKVIMTDENMPESILISVHNDDISIVNKY